MLLLLLLLPACTCVHPGTIQCQLARARLHTASAHTFYNKHNLSHSVYAACSERSELQNALPAFENHIHIAHTHMPRCCMSCCFLRVSVTGWAARCAIMLPVHSRCVAAAAASKVKSEIYCLRVRPSRFKPFKPVRDWCVCVCVCVPVWA